MGGDRGGQNQRGHRGGQHKRKEKDRRSVQVEAGGKTPRCNRAKTGADAAASRGLPRRLVHSSGSTTRNARKLRYRSSASKSLSMRALPTCGLKAAMPMAAVTMMTPAVSNGLHRDQARDGLVAQSTMTGAMSSVPLESASHRAVHVATGLAKTDVVGENQARGGHDGADHRGRRKGNEGELCDAERRCERLAAVRPAIDQPSSGQRRDRRAERDTGGFRQGAAAHGSGEKRAHQNRGPDPIAAYEHERQRQAGRRPQRRRGRIDPGNQRAGYGKAEIGRGDGDQFERVGRSLEDTAQIGRSSFAGCCACHAESLAVVATKKTRSRSRQYSIVPFRLNICRRARRNEILSCSDIPRKRWRHSVKRRSFAAAGPGSAQYLYCDSLGGERPLSPLPVGWRGQYDAATNFNPRMGD